jgi:hypothetical protein
LLEVVVVVVGLEIGVKVAGAAVLAGLEQAQVFL